MNREMRTLDIHLDGTLCGSVSGSSSGMSFTYSPRYLALPEKIPLSLMLPLDMRGPSPEKLSRKIENFLWGLLPDNPSTLARWQREHDVPRHDLLGLLEAVGQDTAGAVQITRQGDQPSDAPSGGLIWPPATLSDREFEDIITNLSSHDDWSAGRPTGRWSLAGAQNKVALHRTVDDTWALPGGRHPSTHILKPDLGAYGYPLHAWNEYLCLKTLHAMGLPTARVEVLEVRGQPVFCAQRFDRVFRQDAWHRVHQEDFCQALGVDPLRKYQQDGGPNLKRIATVLDALTPEENSEQARALFFVSLVVNATMLGTDAHPKNYSILHLPGQSALAPFYDVGSHIPYPMKSPHLYTSALRIGRTYRYSQMTSEDWDTAARQLGVEQERARHLLQEVPQRFETALTQVLEDNPLPHEAQHMGEKLVAGIRMVRSGAFPVRG